MTTRSADSADVMRRFLDATDHGVGGWEDQYAGTLDPTLRPRPDKRYPTLAPLPLPATFPASDRPALAVIADTSGDGAPAPLDLDTIARLLFFTNGITKRLRVGGRSMAFRAAPCTGALYHEELYVVCGDLPGLPAGVYHYGAHDNALRRLRAGDYRAVEA